MKLTAHALSAETFGPMLKSLSAILDKAAEHARATAGADPDAYVTARLAPDMFTLAQQVQTACDHAKNGVGRLTGQPAPRFEDNEKTLDELKARVARTLDYLAGVPESAFAGAEERAITFPGPPGMEFAMDGGQYLRDWALPNFYFHLVTAYDILRHLGVDVGKRDYLGRAGTYIRAKG